MKLFLRRTCVLNLVMQLFLCFVGVRERAEVFTQRRKGMHTKEKEEHCSLRLCSFVFFACKFSALYFTQRRKGNARKERIGKSI